MTQEYGGNSRGLTPSRMTVGVAANAVIQKGNSVAFNATRFAIEGTTVAGGAVQFIGRAIHKADATGLADGALLLEIDLEIQEWTNSTTDPVDATCVGKVVFLESASVVAKTSSGGTLIQAGIMSEFVDPIATGIANKVAVFGNYWVSDLARAAAEADAVTPGGIPLAHAPCRNIVPGNVASLAAYTVAGNDGVTNVAGDRVLLVGQTTPAQNGVYVVGTVTTGTAPLTRATDLPVGATLPNGTVIEVSEGTEYAGSSWKAMSTTTGGAVIGTNDPKFYPRVYKKTVTLVAGAYTIGAGGGGENLFLFSTTKSQVTPTRNTANTSTATTGGYTAPVASRTAGIAGTAALLVHAEVAAGTLNNADVSSLDVVATNW
jgi:hypothetical protein